MGFQAEQETPERHQRTLDEEAERELFRLQEPCECRREAQIHTTIRGDECLGSRQSSREKLAGREEQLQRSLRRQRLRGRGDFQSSGSQRLTELHQ